MKLTIMLAACAAVLVTGCTSDDAADIPATSQTQSEVAALVGTVAGLPGERGYVNGPGATARFNDPFGLAVDEDGTLYVADHENNVIRKISPSGDVSTFAGSGVVGATDGDATHASFWGPAGIALDSSGNLFVADALNHRIRKVTPAGEVSTIAGGGPSGMGEGGFADGPAGEARFKLPKGIAVGADGIIYVADTDNRRVRRIEGGQVTTYAGTGGRGTDNGGRLQATFGQISGIAIADDGTIYVVDQPGNSIRRITPGGDVGTVNLDETLQYPASASVSGELLLVADTSGQRVLALERTQSSALLIAGSGEQGWADGPAEIAQFSNPAAVVLDPATDRLFVSDGTNSVIRVISDWR